MVSPDYYFAEMQESMFYPTRLGIVAQFLTFAIVSLAFGGGLPELPDQNFDYFGYAVSDLPQHFRGNGRNGVVQRDNTPQNNQITNAVATLGRVLFYDKRLSHNNSTACASCHQQNTGFADSEQFSTGFEGGKTNRHSMALVNTKFYEDGNMFWDERAGSLEQQVLQPIQDEVEMGMNLDDLREKLSNTSYYADLFAEAFGSAEITNDRISRSLSQFVRSMVSYESKFDSAFNGAQENFEDTFTASELRGSNIFHGGGRCDDCHESRAQVADQTHNTGLDRTITDIGAGDGEFKVPSLRNVAVRERFMHDGRFETLEEVIQFYSTGVQNNGELDRELRRNGGQAIRFNFSQREMNDLVAFLETLTDPGFLTNEIFSDLSGPFVMRMAAEVAVSTI